MKIVLLLTGIFCFSSVNSQSEIKLQQIDSLVNLINQSSFEIQTDTILQDRPDMGMTRWTYQTVFSKGNELMKLINKVSVTTKENGVEKQHFSTNTFYYDHNKLVKVEEYSTEGNIQSNALWYYENDKPLSNTSRAENAGQRAELLLKMANKMLAGRGYK